MKLWTVVRFLSGWICQVSTYTIGCITLKICIILKPHCFCVFSGRQSALLLERNLFNLHKTFLDEVFTECGIHPKTGAIPVFFEEPVFGDSEGSFTQFMTPGVVTT